MSEVALRFGRNAKKPDEFATADLACSEIYLPILLLVAKLFTSSIRLQEKAHARV
jgi:hypothetical protein